MIYISLGDYWADSLAMPEELYLRWMRVTAIPALPVLFCALEKELQWVGLFIIIGIQVWRGTSELK